MRAFRLPLLLAALTGAVPALAADFVYTGPVTIPANLAVGLVQPFPITFNVSGVGTVADVNLSFAGLSHSYADDLMAALVSPGGTAVVVMNRAGGSANWVNATLTFDQQAAAPLSDGDGAYGGNGGTIPAGSYRPSAYGPSPVLDFLTNGSDLDLFNGEDGNGIWSLYMLDNKILDKGSLASVTLSIASMPVPAVPEPASWALMIAGFGLAGGLLRRNAVPVLHLASS
jgi:subtilisin-like proprotein convertase family protein